MLNWAETWQMTEKVEDILKHCDRKMMRYMAGVSWTDRIPSVEVVNRCGLTDIREEETVSVVWTCEKGEV